jgi:flagellar basal-body rod modification protein FlgD
MAIDAITSMTENPASIAGRNTKAKLGQDDFMKILVAQLRNQDPLTPMEDKDFIAQMAQFSTLEQMESLNTGALFSQACALVGKDVYSLIGNGDGTTQAVFGKVQSVQTIQGIPYLDVGGKLIPYSTDLIVYAGSDIGAPAANDGVTEL